MSDLAPALGALTGALDAPEVAVRAGRRRMLTPWAVTLTATAVSTCALDGVATAAGALVAASHALRGLQHWQTLVLLAASYAAWGAGLRANLHANWSLLEQTATSTNALSKAAHDLAKLRTASVRARRIASAAGYVSTELAKEAPYYAGAFGVAVLSNSVSSNDAIVFLAGTNLGAAGYEYGLARVTRSVLRSGSPRTYASSETDRAPGEYLAQYYGEWGRAAPQHEHRVDDPDPGGGRRSNGLHERRFVEQGGIVQQPISCAEELSRS